MADRRAGGAGRPIALILPVVAAPSLEEARAWRDVRSPDHWDEGPDGRRHPTGWEEPAEPDRWTGREDDDPPPADRGPPRV
ncbi:hypothetical protein BJF83_15655 [Nocardiopsis sp. CNR-923]|uniref:hypothetical protein n=1 Tax=Nocardiopsis sp. CNR-923 TaxID=1904965 RepID=UPI00095EA030|nr:hypothetical protein [Nocardiopsis sp. CNR-923]OLT28322.1 hypothetical protein BJF83_15655 [Nocardiopsis sp. CNR-923]